MQEHTLMSTHTHTHSSVSCHIEGCNHNTFLFKPLFSPSSPLQFHPSQLQGKCCQKWQLHFSEHGYVLPLKIAQANFKPIASNKFIKNPVPKWIDIMIVLFSRLALLPAAQCSPEAFCTKMAGNLYKPWNTIKLLFFSDPYKLVVEFILRSLIDGYLLTNKSHFLVNREVLIHVMYYVWSCDLF